MRRIVLFPGMLSMLIMAAFPALAIEGPEIIRRMEENRDYKTAYIEGRMIIDDRFGTRTSTFTMWTRGTEEALVEFTSAQERGQKVLRTENEIYLYYPDAAELIRLQGAALRQSMLGSDVSYEDMTGSRGLLDSYRAELTGEEPVQGEPCYVVRLEAEKRDVAYPRQTIWVDKDDFVMRRAEQYALSGRLLKEMEVVEVMETAGHSFASHLIVKDALKRNSRTEFVIEQADLGVEIPPGTFSLQELSF